MADFLDYFDVEFMPKLGMRAPTFRAVFREMTARHHKVLVETGCARKQDNWEGDGQSTLMWAAYARFNQASFKTIDIDQEAVDLVSATANLPEGSHAICNDSVKELAKHRGTIDLLYLDSYDVDMNNQHPAALHCMFELLSARKHLISGSIVFVDDSPVGPDFEVQGKGRYVAEYFKQMGIQPFTFAYQVAWLMP